jgi:hypothetical protein
VNDPHEREVKHHNGRSCVDRTKDALCKTTGGAQSGSNQYFSFSYKLRGVIFVRTSLILGIELVGFLVQSARG